MEDVMTELENKYEIDELNKDIHCIMMVREKPTTK